MAEIPISLTCADYARVMPLATREVKPEGIALTMIYYEGNALLFRAYDQKIDADKKRPFPDVVAMDAKK